MPMGLAVGRRLEYGLAEMDLKFTDNVRPETRPDRLAAATAWVHVINERRRQTGLVRGLLLEIYTPEEAAVFMTSRNRLLDGRVAAEMIEAGQGQAVIDMLRRLVDGVYL